MKTKTRTVYICNQCGGESLRWNGKCPSCGEWNTLEETVIETAKKSSSLGGGNVIPLGTSLEPTGLTDIETSDEIRYHTGLGELDRVLGGGIVKGSLVLLAGEPGAGKSTLLLQISEYLSKQVDVLYVTGEESARQIKLRADRLGIHAENIKILANTDIKDICATIISTKPGLVIVDSIQTMNHDDLSSSPGTVSQIRECTNYLMKTAKSEEIPVFIVGHVNKEGSIAGPKVLEHIVDTVLYFEGERNLVYRILRAAKNRYGSTNEIGVFDMTDGGLHEVENPSQMLVMDRPVGASGTCVACVIEGSRPILAEVQALVSKTSFGIPRRTSNGFDINRTNLLIAVMEKRAGFSLSSMDVYLNVVGGLRLDEPAVDLTVAMAIYSNLIDLSLGDDILAIGEIGLTGEVRGVQSIEQRITEASRMGFTKLIIPKNNFQGLKLDFKKLGIQVFGVGTISEAFSRAKTLTTKQ